MTMRAITQDRYGTPEVLAVAEVGRPTAGVGEVVIEVAASSLNIADWHMTTGTPAMVRAVAGLTKPKRPVPGADVAGVIVELGPDVDELAVGDRVFGDIGAGAWAEYAVGKPRQLTSMPDGVGFEQAAAVPLAGITALQGLRDRAEVGPGKRVLVNGASGGVGTFAVQIAKALGASHVTAVCSTAKIDQARAIGADQVVDYTRAEFTETERDYDVLFDNVGDRSWSETRRVLAHGGINVTITGPKHGVAGPMREMLVRKVQSQLGGRRFTWFTAVVRSDDLAVLAGWLAEGAVTPVIEKVYPLDQAPVALAYLGEGHAHGKLVLTI